MGDHVLIHRLSSGRPRSDRANLPDVQTRVASLPLPDAELVERILGQFTTHVGMLYQFGNLSVVAPAAILMQVPDLGQMWPGIKLHHRNKVTSYNTYAKME